jgi:hypothetical protein
LQLSREWLSNYEHWDETGTWSPQKEGDL